MKILHFECFAGISGDMALGAFVDLGVDPDDMRKELDKLGLEGWKLDFVREERNGITGTRAHVDIENSHGHHRHEHHQHDHSHHEHHHHSWRDIRLLIEQSGIREGAKKRGLDIFHRIAEAESRVHGVPVEDIAFHEVGAVDSIIDITGAAVCLDLLKPGRVTCGEIELGGGTVQCAHGILPVPAPAVLLLLKGAPVKTGGFDKEMTTPTGAAILASSVDEYTTGAASFRVGETGVGIGTRKLDKPNILRVSFRESAAMGLSDAREKPWVSEELIIIEANIDDMTGEALGFLMERFFEAGALDVTLSPCTMKKSRPGTVVSVLCNPEKSDSLRELFFRFSTTIGFRETRVNRLSLKREERILAGDFGELREKTVFLGSEKRSSKIEFEDRAALARKQGVSLDEAERLILGGNYERS
ncbi:MAG: nickel pincer cofactor biosynthesis protein LarC [Treponema sp.]|nr:nickel pincer cofactor biosynthesis protein LarC [Treponema sp.]